MAGKRIKHCFGQGMEKARQGRWQEAADAFARALQMDAAYAPAVINLGYALYVLGRHSEAEAYLRRGIELEPTAISAYNNLGLVLLDEERPQEAERCFRQALELEPDCAEVLNNLALALENQNMGELAECEFRRAVHLDPGYYEAWYNLGRLLKTFNRLPEAEMCYRQALRIHPRYALAAFALAAVRLLQGDYEQGWQHYGALRTQSLRSRFAALPCWQGENLQGKKILLFQEQGFGDTIQFVRYARFVAAAAGQTALWVQQPLVRIFAHSLKPLTIYSEAEEALAAGFDFACPLPALPAAFKTRLNNIPGQSPYLQALPELKEKWRQRIPEWGQGLRVGVVWSGNPRHLNDHQRSVPFSLLREWFSVPGISWINLQVGNASRQATEPLVDYSAEMTDFAETAGIIDHLDLVISVDSAVGHLAGAMGKPTWMLIPFAPDWRWLLERQDSPWYPSLRLFRQQKQGDWTMPVKDIKDRLRQLLTGSGQQ